MVLKFEGQHLSNGLVPFISNAATTVHLEHDNMGSKKTRSEEHVRFYGLGPLLYKTWQLQKHL